MDCIVQGVAKSWTRLSDFHFHFTFHFFLMLPNSIPCVWRLLAGLFPLSCELCQVKERVLCFVCVLAGGYEYISDSTLVKELWSTKYCVKICFSYLTPNLKIAGSELPPRHSRPWGICLFPDLCPTPSHTRCVRVVPAVIPSRRRATWNQHQEDCVGVGL